MPSTHEITIWDRFVRLFHWSVAGAFLLDFWVFEEGDPPHEWVGYFLGGLLALRIIWGFIGPHNARFSSFFPTPTRVKKHLADLQEGHIDIANMKLHGGTQRVGEQLTSTKKYPYWEIWNKQIILFVTGAALIVMEFTFFMVY